MNKEDINNTILTSGFEDDINKLIKRLDRFGLVHTDINNSDMPAQDKLEIINNLWLYLDPENYEKHTKILIKECNEELKWRGKK